MQQEFSVQPPLLLLHLQPSSSSSSSLQTLQTPPLPNSSSSSSPPIPETEILQPQQQSQPQQTAQPNHPLSVPLLGDEIASLIEGDDANNNNNQEEVTLENLWNDLLDYSEGHSSVDDSHLRCCCCECDCCAAFLFPIICPIWTVYSVCCFPVYCLFHCRFREKGPWSQVCCNCRSGREKGRREEGRRGGRTDLLTGENLQQHNNTFTHNTTTTDNLND